MNGAARRTKIVELLQSGQTPIPGGELAKRLGVSRQVVVQDIALIRAENKNILSTNKGYLLYHAGDFEGQFRRVFHVRHTTEQLLDELLAIVELGGRVLDVSVEHALYGQISCDLIINTRRDALEFHQKLTQEQGTPLKILTGDEHYHTVCAGSVRLLDVIEQELGCKGFLIPAAD